MYSTENPVLLIVFNRPNETRAIFDVLRTVRPKRLYVAADAPRANKPGESARCAETLGIFEKIDWPCDVFFKINESNLGSHTSIPQAIDWFFDNEEEGIVLEDDCVPSWSFFKYCDELLKKYRDDNRIMWINGSNVGFKSKETDSTYLFSIYAISWGWASWRRAWRLFGGSYRTALEKGTLGDILQRHVGHSFMAQLYWRYIFEYAYGIKNWDFRWLNAFWGSGGLACTPTVNLISNIGYGIEAMHGGRRNDRRGHIPAGDISSVNKGPKVMVPCIALDNFLDRTFYRIGVRSILQAFLAARVPRLRNAVRKMQAKSI